MAHLTVTSDEFIALEEMLSNVPVEYLEDHLSDVGPPIGRSVTKLVEWVGVLLQLATIKEMTIEPGSHRLALLLEDP